MISRSITISSDGISANMNEDIFIYKGDGDVSIHFTINDIKYICINEGIETDFEYCSFKIKKPIGNIVPIPQSLLIDGEAILVITKEMIDEDLEVGEHEFIVYLYDKLQNRLTIPSALKFIVLEGDW